MTTEANKQLCRDYFTAFLKIAELRGIRLNGERSNGLAYFNRAYHQLGASAPAP